jgi:hypothetical protein
MPTFDTPQAISVGLEVGVGDVLIEASDRTETVGRFDPRIRATRRCHRGRTNARRVLRRPPCRQGPSKWRQW